MAWHPKTLADSGVDLTPAPARKGVNRAMYRCACGALRPAELLIDVRALDVPQDWACDGCWTGWQREGKPVDGGPAPADRNEWLERWCAALDAPPQVLAKLRSRRPVARYSGVILRH